MEPHTDLQNFADDADDELDGKLSPDFFSQAVLYGTDWTVKTILQQIEQGNIDLSPDFQRRDAWSSQNKSRFIESVALQLPIPQIVLAERKDRRGTYIVLDGKQRLITLAQFAGQLPDDHPVIEMSKTTKPLRLSGLRILDDLNKKTYADLEGDVSLYSVKTQFDNHTIRSALIRNWPNEDYLYEVFIRLNTGSAKLSPQELRQAMKPGKFTQLLSQRASESKSLQLILGIDAPDFRMRDVDLLLRLIAYSCRLSEYRGNLKLFLDDTHEFFNENWSSQSSLAESLIAEINDGLEFLIKNFRDASLVGRRYKDGKFETAVNRALLDVQLNSVLIQPNRRLIEANGLDLRETTARLCEINPKFVQAISGTTKSIDAVQTRFMIWKDAVEASVGTIQMAGV